MRRVRNPNRDKAFELYKDNQGNITLKQIAEILSEKERNIKFWKKEDDWDGKYNPKGGAPLGNQNALGNDGGAPEKNQNARTEGWYSKYYPTVARNLIKEAEESGGSLLDIQWAMIMTKWIAIIRAQKIMYVKDQDDMTKELKKFKVNGDNSEEEYDIQYDIQYAWDKHANFLNSQSRAMVTLSGLIKRYEDMLKEDLTAEEQKLRVDKLKLSMDATKQDIVSKKEEAKKKHKLAEDKFEHQKDIDSKKYW
jgi:uncharacterized protein YjcR